MKTHVLDNVDPADWAEHRFGLTPERWAGLNGKSYWITGAGTGYGRCIACGLAAAGARVFLTGRRRDKLQESIEEAASLGIPTANCHIVEADLTRQDEIARACDKVRGLCGSLNGLVNNAAIPTEPGSSTPLQSGSPEYWSKMMATNVTAAWLLTKGIFPHMLASGGARVLLISSDAGWANDTPGNGMYKVSKAALNSLGRAAACEYAHAFPDKDIQINVLVAGEARTEMNKGSERSPYSIVSMVLMLLSHPGGGPNGRYFRRNGSHIGFANAIPYDRPLV
ncbi:MAG: SDR family oxidoreductase [Sedimentisphaerales bacterium]|nr:SDR family oxidoreductase [Sedimentisphaerales bacterium]